MFTLVNIYPVEWRIQRPSLGGFHRGFAENELAQLNSAQQTPTGVQPERSEFNQGADS